MNKALLELVEISRYSAKHPSFVQGGGGNCSVKTQTRMYIKASGFFLEDVTLKTGFVILNLKNKNLSKKTNLKPSLETAIHSQLGKYVIHTHPIYVGAIVCTKEGKKLYKKLFPEINAYWVDYASPGTKLSQKIQAVIKKNKIDVSNDCILLLQNHGVFVTASKKNKCIKLHEYCVQKLESFFPRVKLKATSKTVGIQKYLTPDHIVYSNVKKENLSIKQRIASDELDEYSRLVTHLINKKRLHAQYLSKKQVDYIKSMKKEKYRQKLIG